MAEIALDLLLRFLGAPVVAPADLLLVAVATVAVLAVVALAGRVLAGTAARSAAAPRTPARPRSARRWAAQVLPSADPDTRPRPRAPQGLLPTG